MIFTVTALPSVAETHGSQRPNVTVPFVSTAPRVRAGAGSEAWPPSYASGCGGKNLRQGVGMLPNQWEFRKHKYRLRRNSMRTGERGNQNGHLSTWTFKFRAQ